MTKREANKLSMLDAVISHMESNSEKLASIPVLGEIVVNLKSSVTEIKSMNLEFIGNTKGKTADKALKEEAVLNTILKIANSLYVLGIKTKNPELIVNCKVTKWELDNLREQVLIKKSKDILSMANQYAEILVNYGITADLLTEALSHLNGFQTAIDEKSDAHSNSVAEREALSIKFADVTAILVDELDPLMELFEDTEPLFYDAYRNARMIRDLGIRHEKEEEISTTAI